MKVKDVERTANVAWSPKTQTPILLAAGTAAQQLDASFNTNAALEIYSLNLAEPGPDMVLKSSAPSENRFHKIVWGAHGGDQTSGTIVGGCDRGLIQIYSASKLLNGENGLVCRQDKHTGPVHALDFNPFQQNLFATGAAESEIFIWDLNNTNTPMSPGTKSQPSEDVLSTSWNRQVQHILASTFASKCVIWDLRKNEPIIKLTDTVSRVRWKMIAWHPEVATQLCLASEEDHSPIIQLWDLRFATSPLKTLENHQRGVLSVAWCSQDSDLLVSCGKDNRILAWNPNSNEPNGEVLSEIAKTTQWNFDIQWCPRNPAIIACPSFDGHVSIYSLMGGKTQQIQTTNKIADSFPGMDGYVQAPVMQPSSAPASVDLSKPPKWLKRPVGARFGFGGKLISFDNAKPAVDNQTGQPPRSVQISQVITEPELIQKSNELEQALEYGNFTEYCLNKADSTDDQHKKYIWHFLRANLDENPRVELLNLLGYPIEDVNNLLNHHLNKNTVDGLTSRIANLNKDPFDAIAESKPATAPFKIITGEDTEGLITQALILGNVEAAVELCLKAKRFADAIIIAMTGDSDLLARTRDAYLAQCEGNVSALISALASEDWTSIMNNCDLSSWKEALAATLTHSSDEALPLLCEYLGKRLETEGRGDPKSKQDSQLCYICSGSFDNLVKSWSGNARNSTKDLQELVELVVFLQKSVERQGRQVQISGALADLLTYYAGLLASQGNLQTALTYLGDSQDEKVTSLRDRLHISLGQKPFYARQQSQSRRQSQRTSFSSYPNVGGQFNTGLPNPAVSAAQPWQPPPQVSRTFSPVPATPPTHPPRPTSVGSNHGGSGLPQRKYVLDPSVTSNPYGAPTRNMMYQPLPPQPVPSFQNNNYGGSMTPLIPNNNYVPNPPLTSTPMVPNIQPPPPMGGEIGQPALEKHFQPSAPGWNDPPLLHKPLRSQLKPEQTSLSSQPITHPIYGATPTNNGYGQEAPQMFQPPPTAPYGQLPPTFNQSGFKPNAVNFNQAQNQQQNIAPEQPQPVQKPPIPEEHMHMQTVFDELKYQCSCAANNPQTKRKLEDVGRKLEALYDLLRERKLSPNTLASLHELVQLVQNGNYTGGLDLHTQLVAGPDFAQIASFMPGLKVKAANNRPKSVYSWTVTDVQKWLRRHCSDYYALYVDKFVQNDITGRTLIRINDNSLLRLGIADVDHREAIWREILKLRLKTDIMEIRDLQRRNTNNMFYEYSIA
ncbi:transport Sec31A [Asbolus verrucosus]|uniref:Protein transport protein Sec31A n=1 Tax=Asbolus verrucosus TaxID=1661398 RepID=A0A482VJJ4_ASBVE|nr:transport Sec31A [Asbolus verrucosus]